MKIGFNRSLMLTLDPISFFVSESLVIFQNHERDMKLLHGNAFVV
jgi:hypothetical protein